MLRRLAVCVGWWGLCFAIGGCVTVRSLDIEPIDPAGTQPIVVESPVKVHLLDGSTVVFRNGIRVVGNEVTGEGFRYDAMLKLEEPVVAVPLDEVAAMESFQTPVNTGATAAASTGATVGGALGGAALFKAIFGSCPTTYSFADGEPLLEAESFSYSIAPGFETLDVDRLGLRTRDPVIELEMRNEALETHYIDQVALFGVEHGAGESVYAGPDHRPFVVAAPAAARSAVDSEGRELFEVLRDSDGVTTRASDARLQGIGLDDMADHLDLVFDVEPGVEYALLLEARNSLLNTVLLYDVMLAGQGFRAIDWMGRDLSRLLGRWRLARWYWNNMGLHVAVEVDGRFRPVASFEDTGPIAWKDLALRLPVSEGKRVVLRLTSVSDNWRIDRAALARVIGDAQFSSVSLGEVRDATGALHETARDHLAGSASG